MQGKRTAEETGQELRGNLAKDGETKFGKQVRISKAEEIRMERGRSSHLLGKERRCGGGREGRRLCDSASVCVLEDVAVDLLQMQAGVLHPCSRDSLGPRKA